MSTTSVSLPLGLAAAILLVGCGADGPDTAAVDATETADAATAPTTPATTAAATTATAPADDAADREPNGIVIEVLARDNSFLPEDIEITAGTEVRWENRGRNDHNVLPADDTLDWGVDVDAFAPGDVYSALFDTPGTYPYYCSLHGTSDFGMIGTIVVTE